MAEFIRFIQVSLIVAAAVYASAGAEEALPRVALKDSAVASGDVVTLSDVADLGDGVPAEVGRIVLGNPPWPGHVRRISRVLVKTKLVMGGFDLSRFEFAGSEACLVEAASIRVEGQEIVTAARKHIEAHFAEHGPRVRVEPLHGVAPVVVSAGDGPVELRPALSSAGLPAGSVRVDVDLVRGAVQVGRAPVTFAVRLQDRVAVASRGIAAGEAFTEQNVNFLEKDVAPSGAPHVRSWAELSGKTAISPVRPGEVLTRRMVCDPDGPVVIQPNQQVFLVVQVGAVRAVAMGKSLGRARKGELARARNVSTGRDVMGVAVDSGTIWVFVEGESHDE